MLSSKDKKLNNSSYELDNQSIGLSIDREKIIEEMSKALEKGRFEYIVAITEKIMPVLFNQIELESTEELATVDYLMNLDCLCHCYFFLKRVSGESGDKKMEKFYHEKEQDILDLLKQRMKKTLASELADGSEKKYQVTKLTAEEISGLYNLARKGHTSALDTLNQLLPNPENSEELYHKLLSLHSVNECFLYLDQIEKKKDRIIKNFEEMLKIIQDHGVILQKIYSDLYLQTITNIYLNHLRIFYFFSNNGNNTTLKEIINFKRFINCGIRGIQVNKTNKAGQQLFSDFLNKAVLEKYDVNKLPTERMINLTELKKWENAVNKEIDLSYLHHAAMKSVENNGYTLEAKGSLEIALNKCYNHTDVQSKINKLKSTILLARCYKEENNLIKATDRFQAAINQLNSLKSKEVLNIPPLWALYLEYGLLLLLDNDYDKALKELKKASDCENYFSANKDFFKVNSRQILQIIAKTFYELTKRNPAPFREFLECFLSRLIELNKKPTDEEVEILIKKSKEQLEQLNQQKVLEVTKKAAEQQPKNVENFLKKSEPKKTPAELQAEKEAEAKRAEKEKERIAKRKEKELREEKERQKKIELQRLEKERQKEEKEKEKREALRKKQQEKSHHKKEKLKNKSGGESIVSKKAARKAARVKNNFQKDETAEKQRLLALKQAKVEAEEKERVKKLAARKKKQEENIKNIDKSIFKEVIPKEKPIDEIKQIELIKTQEKSKEILSKKVKKENQKKAKKAEKLRQAEEARLLKIEKEKEEKEANIRRQAEDARLLKIKKDQEEKKAAKRKAIEEEKESIKKSIIQDLFSLKKSEEKDAIKSIHAGLIDVGLSLHYKKDDQQKIIKDDPILSKLKLLNDALKSDELLKSYGLELIIQGTAVLEFYLAKKTGGIINFDANDLDLFIYNAPRSHFAEEGDELTEDEEKENKAHQRLQDILKKCQFNYKKDTSYFSNYTHQAHEKLQLTVAYDGYVSNDPFYFTQGKMHFSDKDGLELINEEDLFPINDVTLECDLIKANDPHIVNFFARLLKYYEKAQKNGFELGENFKIALCLDGGNWQYNFLLTKFLIEERSLAEHSNVLEMINVIKGGFLDAEKVQPQTVAAAKTLLTSFCKALYYKRFNKKPNESLSPFMIRDILLAYYAKKESNVDFLAEDLEFLLNHEKLLFSQSIDYWVSELIKKNNPLLKPGYLINPGLFGYAPLLTSPLVSSSIPSSEPTIFSPWLAYERSPLQVNTIFSPVATTVGSTPSPVSSSPESTIEPTDTEFFYRVKKEK